MSCLSSLSRPFGAEGRVVSARSSLISPRSGPTDFGKVPNSVADKALLVYGRAKVQSLMASAATLPTLFVLSPACLLCQVLTSIEISCWASVRYCISVILHVIRCCLTVVLWFVLLSVHHILTTSSIPAPFPRLNALRPPLAD